MNIQRSAAERALSVAQLSAGKMLELKGEDNSKVTELGEGYIALCTVVKKYEALNFRLQL